MGRRFPKISQRIWHPAANRPNFRFRFKKKSLIRNKTGGLTKAGPFDHFVNISPKLPTNYNFENPIHLHQFSKKTTWRGRVWNRFKRGIRILWEGFKNKPPGLLMVWFPGQSERRPATSVERSIHQVIRNSFLSRIQNNSFRNSPTMPTENIIRLEIPVHPKTLLPVRHPGERVKDRDSVQILTLYADVKDNRIVLGGETLHFITDQLAKEDLPWGQRIYLNALKTVHNQKLIGEDGMGHPKQREMTAERFEKIQEMLSNPNLILGATIFFTFGLHPLDPEVLVGFLIMDPQGEIMGTSLARPDFNSPRGTQYEKGIVSKDHQWVWAVVGFDGSLLHYDAKGLNPAQQNTLESFFKHPNNQECLQKHLQFHPYILDMIQRTETGKLLGQIKNIYASSGFTGTIKSTTMALVKIRDRFRILPHPLPPQKRQTKLLSVLELEVSFHEVKGTPTRAKFRVISGVVPEKIMDLFEFVETRINETWSKKKSPLNQWKWNNTPPK